MALIKERIKSTGDSVTYWKIVNFSDTFPENRINVGFNGYRSREDRFNGRQESDIMTISLPSISFNDRHNPLPELYNAIKKEGFFHDSIDDLQATVIDSSLEIETPAQEG